MTNRTKYTLLLLVIFGTLVSCKEEEPPVNSYPCVDYKGNSYKTVVIGDQVWMAENLATKYLSDGTEIYASEVVKSWSNKNVLQYSYFLEKGYYSHYGLLYNYKAAIERELAPKGWRLPTKEDWKKLENYIRSQKYSYEATDSSDWVGKALASNDGWRLSSVVGAIGNNPLSNNATGFNAIPCGFRTFYGAFSGESDVCAFWTSTIIDSTTNNLQVVMLKNDWADIQWETVDMENGACYIRCVRDL